MTSSITSSLVTLTIDGVTSLLQLTTFKKCVKYAFQSKQVSREILIQTGSDLLLNIHVPMSVGQS